MNDKNIKIVFEIGSWLGGGSTRHFGQLLKKDGGRIFAIDHWKGSSTQQTGNVDYLPILENAYEQFLSNIIHYKLEEVVIPCRMDSSDVFLNLHEIIPDLIYIDGEHTVEGVLNDLYNSFKFLQLNPNCVICGDDWECDSVKIAVKQFALNTNSKIEASGNFYRLYTPK